MKYQQVSTTHLVQPETFKLISEVPAPSSEPSVIAVPFFFSKFSPDDTVRWGQYKVKCKTELVFQLSLNQLFVSWENGRDYHKGHLDFKDERTGHQVFMTLDVTTNTAVSYSQVGTDEVFYGVDYRLQSTAFENKVYRQEYRGQDQTDIQFIKVPDLGTRGVYRIGKNEFSMGISANQWKVRYRGKLLHGTCYALLCGTWAILLSDDLKFDSLVYLNGVQDGTLLVEEIPYTANPYIIKVLTLSKQKR